MDKDAVDGALARLEDAYRQAGTAMFAIDGHPALALLRGGTQHGRTAGLATGLLAEVDLLWAHFTIVGQRLDEAKTLRPAHRPGEAGWDRLVALLSQPCVRLDADELPVTVTAAPPATQATLADLLAGLDHRSRRVTQQLSEVDDAIGLLVNALDELSAALEHARVRATALGSTHLGGAHLDGADRLAAIAEELSGVRDVWLADVLSTVDNGALTSEVAARCDRIASSLAEAHRALDAVERLRATYPSIRAALAGEIDALAQVERSAADLTDTVRRKIADSRLPDPPSAADRSRARLPAAQTSQEVEANQWETVADELAALAQSIKAARRRVDEFIVIARGLLDRRVELRGRLAAYRAKAAAVGLAEDETLTTSYLTAHDLLYQAPCDLRQATRAVRDYQLTLSALTPSVAGRKEPTS